MEHGRALFYIILLWLYDIPLSCVINSHAGETSPGIQPFRFGPCRVILPDYLPTRQSGVACGRRAAPFAIAPCCGYTISL
ncbi:hypothetical protein B0H14DRAFT_2834537 [Mycena olivaceomarginata]|nr:hypothetical protein B0H14DRAFT_2834537 [Mycena olivaceomarginata]